MIIAKVQQMIFHDIGFLVFDTKHFPRCTGGRIGGGGGELTIPFVKKCLCLATRVVTFSAIFTLEKQCVILMVYPCSDLENPFLFFFRFWVLFFVTHGTTTTVTGGSTLTPRGTRFFQKFFQTYCDDAVYRKYNSTTCLEFWSTWTLWYYKWHYRWDTLTP